MARISTASPPSARSTRIDDAPGRHARTTPSCRPRTLCGSAWCSSNDTVGSATDLRAARGMSVLLPTLQTLDGSQGDPLPLGPVGPLVAQLVEGFFQLESSEQSAAGVLVSRQQRRHLFDPVVAVEEGAAVAGLPGIGQG